MTIQAPLVVAILSLLANQTRDVEARLYRLWHPVSGQPVALVAVDASAQAMRASGGWAPPMSFTVMRWTRRIASLPTVQRTASFPLVGATVRGLLELPGSDAVDTWQLILRAPGSGTRRTDVVRLTPLSGTSPILSDLVMGQQGDAAEWWGTGEPMPVAAVPRFRRDRPLELLAQLKSAVALSGLRLRISVDDVDQPFPALQSSVSIESRLDLTPGITTIRRTLALEQLSGRHFRVALVVLAAQGDTVSSRETSLAIE